MFLVWDFFCIRQDESAGEVGVECGCGVYVHCYAIEGSYPESLQYLKDNYGLTYDEEKYFIDYQVLGSNILPDVTIIDRRNRL